MHVLQCLLRLSLGGRLSVGMTVRHRGCERCGAGQQPSNDGRAGFLSQGNRLNRRRFRQPGKHVLSAIQEDFQHGGRREDDGGHGVRVQSASREAQFASYYRGRDARYRAPPAQNRTGGFPAYGSHLGCLTAKRMLGQGWVMRGLGSQRSASASIRCHDILSF